MKVLDSKFVVIIALALAAMALAQVYLSNRSSERSAHKAAVTNAIKDFPLPHDAAHQRGDTITFYKKDSLVGTSIVEVD